MRAPSKPPLFLGLFGVAAIGFAVAALASLGPVRASTGRPLAQGRSEPSLPTSPDARPERVRAPTRTAYPKLAEEPARALTISRNASALRGTVRDLRGEPVEGAAILATVLLPSRTDAPRSDDDELATLALTDVRGEFVAFVPPGDYALFATSGDRSSALLEPLSVVPGEQLEALELVLTGRSTLSGFVVDAQGRPTEGTLLVRLRGHARTLKVRALPPSGAFEVDSLPDGPIEVAARAPHGGASAKRSLGHVEANVIMRLGSPLGELTVQVIDEAGEPVDGAIVQIREVGGIWGGLTFTGASGEASMVPSGAQVRVEASTDDSASDPVDVTMDERPRTVTVRVGRRGAVRGRVLLETGEPASGKVTLSRLDGTGPDSAPSGAELDGSGAFRVGPLPKGSYEVRYDGGERGVVGDATVLPFTIVGSEERILPDLRIDGGRTLHGFVLDESGEPVAHADVYVIDSRDEIIGNKATTTDTAGRFTVAGPVKGGVRLRAEGEGVVSPVVSVDANASEVTLVARGVGHISGVLRGRIASGARVRCTDGLWHPIDDSGQYTLSCSPGSKLEVESSGARHSFPVELEEDEQTYVELRL